MIVDRREMRDEIARLLALLLKQPADSELRTFGGAGPRGSGDGYP